MFNAGNLLFALKHCRFNCNTLLKRCETTVNKDKLTHIFQKAGCSIHAKHFSSSNYDVVIVGAGIIGLSTAMQLKQRLPDTSMCVLEKEPIICRHQTGNNSGVVHAGIYYKPNSLRALLCVEGVESMYKYCQENNIPYKRNGKLIVAVKPKELKWLNDLYIRGNENKVPGLEILCPDEYRQIEPCCGGLKALWSPNTGIINFVDPARHFAQVFRCLNGVVLCDFEVVGFKMGAEGRSVVCGDSQGNDYPITIRSADNRVVRAGLVLTCCGLQADRVAMMTGGNKYPAIVPFRGEYFGMIKAKETMIKTNIYPISVGTTSFLEEKARSELLRITVGNCDVKLLMYTDGAVLVADEVPEPSVPFIGVHYTPKLDGSCWLGPTAMIAYKREQYKWNEFSLRDCWALATFPGLWRFGYKYFRRCLYEAARSFNQRVIYKELRMFVPSLQYKDIYPGAAAGVQAQAMNKDGTFAEDFNIEGTDRVIHCRNMPSPACTSSLAIGRYLSDHIERRLCDIKTGRGRAGCCT